MKAPGLGRLGNRLVARVLDDNRLLAVVAELGVAVGTFVSAVILGRRVGDAVFGQYATAMAGALLMTAATTAVVVEPFLLVPDEVRLTARHRRSVNRFSLAFLAVITVAILGVAAFAWSLGLANEHVVVLIGMAAVTPGQADFIYRRRIAQDRGHQLALVNAGIVYAVLTVGATFVITRRELSSPLCVLIALGIAGAIAGRFAYWGESPGTHTKAIGAIRRDHFTYSRWALPARGVGWMSSNAVFVLGPALFGYAILGQFRMGYSLYQAGARMFPPLAVGLMPRMANTYRKAIDDGLAETEAGKASKRWALLNIALPLIGVALVLAVLSPALIKLFYGDRFTSGSWLAVCSSLMIIPSAIAISLRTLLRSTDRIRTELRAESIGLAIGLALFPVVVFFDGVWAPMVGFFTIVACSVTVLYRRS